MWINELTQAAVIASFSVRVYVQRLTTEVQQHSEQKYISIHCPANETWSLGGRNVRRGRGEMDLCCALKVTFSHKPHTNSAPHCFAGALCCFFSLILTSMADSSPQNVTKFQQL